MRRCAALLGGVPPVRGGSDAGRHVQVQCRRAIHQFPHCLLIVYQCRTSCSFSGSVLTFLIGRTASFVTTHDTELELTCEMRKRRWCKALSHGH